MKAGTVLACTTLIVALLVARPCSALEQLDTDRFSFSFIERDRVAALALAQHADAIAGDISADLGFVFTDTVTVHIAHDLEAFLNIQPAGARVPRWAAGTAYPAENAIFLRRGAGIDLERTFRHEVLHILLGQAFGGTHRVPRWLDEGLAVIQAREWSLSRLSTMTFAVLTGKLLPMDRITRSFPAELRDAELAYCQSFYFISFLKGRFGNSAFQDFLKTYSRLRDFERAITATYHLSWNSLEAEWLKYLRLRFSWLPLLTSSGSLWFAASLIFVWGYVRKKRKTRRTLRQWAREERMLYGDDEPDGQ